ncbi:MAG: hypothetical protein LBV18_01385 [Alistipes sp.]|jgi:hypothetical protein|nr:hypothetical protein [Alistipes sp.]
MKNIIASILTTLLSTVLASAQEADHIDGGHFEKRITYNAYTRTPWPLRQADESKPPRYILDDKSMMDKLFFGFTNSAVEFSVGSVDFMNPTSSGLRLYKDWPDGRDWKIEVIPKGDYTDEMREIRRVTGEIDIPYDYIRLLEAELREAEMLHLVKNILDSVLHKAYKQNGDAQSAERSEETYASLRPETKTFTVGRLGDLLQEKMAALIYNFRSGGDKVIVMDGYYVDFRCVVEGELWSLSIHVPNGRAHQMYALCRRMILDAEKDEFNESEYIEMLEAIEF